MADSFQREQVPYDGAGAVGKSPPNLQPRLSLSHLCPILVPQWNRLQPGSASTDGVGLF